MNESLFILLYSLSYFINAATGHKSPDYRGETTTAYCSNVAAQLD